MQVCHGHGGLRDITRKKTTFTTFFTLLHPFDKFELVKFIVYILDKYNWEHITVFVDKDNRVLETTGDSLYKYLETAQNIFWNYIPVYSTTFTDAEYEEKLIEASASSRVFILFMSINDVRKMMLRAAYLGMTTGDNVYIVPEFQGSARITSDTWRRNDATDVKARKAFRSILFVNILSLPLSSYDYMLSRLNFKVFGNEYLNFLVADKEEQADMDSVSADDREVQQAILAGYYNAIMIYLKVANETLAEGRKLSDGRDIVRRISNRNFEGIAGNIHINRDGHRDTDMALVDMTDPWEGTFERVGTYMAELGELVLTPGVTISWPGGGGPIQDIPECGFQDLLCSTYGQDEESGGMTIGLSTGISGLVIACGVVIVLTLKSRFNQRMKQLTWWKIDISELQSMKINETKSTLSSSVTQSRPETNPSSVFDNTVFMYKGNPVKTHNLSTTNFHMNNFVLREFEEIRDMNHPNLLTMIGACLEGENRVLVTEHCPKGSLHEMLINNTRFDLDLEFMTSLVSDIVKAMIYIHKRSLKCHGRLTSEVCLIDSRFSVKVGSYGLPTIYEALKNDSKQEGNDSDRDKLWTAPEHLRTPDAGGSVTGDIYSLGIIISEILSRDEPYSNDREYLTTREILYKIQFSETPPFRPAVTCTPDLIPLDNLMKQCWDENPEKRPSLYDISSQLNRILNSNSKHGSLVDNLLDRLEKYSNNLEKIVEDKVDELRHEKHKSEELLRQMLPKMVADRLKVGLSVEPEFYESVTIYFSDIVGFTEMCAELQPVQIINLLNDLYSTFDGIIGNYDVYKVETIGDAYMVVSGLPERNGNEHARQIARMSLALVKVISTFTPIETSEERVMLRVGLHSGTVCAGVVGLKMPRYCLFGESVNTASAMEASGMEWKIHMSSSTADILKTFGSFTMKRRGDMEVPGKGGKEVIETYWLLGEKGEAQADTPEEKISV